MHHPTERITHTTTFVTPVVEHWLERQRAERGKKKQKNNSASRLRPQKLRLERIVNLPHLPQGAGRSSEVERSLMVRWIVESILHGVDPLSYLSFHPVLYDWCNKGRGMCYPVCGMVHIKEPLLLIGKSSLYGGSGFPFSLSRSSASICFRLRRQCTYVVRFHLFQ